MFHVVGPLVVLVVGPLVVPVVGPIAVPVVISSVASLNSVVVNRPVEDSGDVTMVDTCVLMSMLVMPCDVVTVSRSRISVVVAALSIVVEGCVSFSENKSILNSVELVFRSVAVCGSLCNVMSELGLDSVDFVREELSLLCGLVSVVASGVENVLEREEDIFELLLTLWVLMEAG